MRPLQNIVPVFCIAASKASLIKHSNKENKPLRQFLKPDCNNNDILLKFRKLQTQYHNLHLKLTKDRT